MTNEWVFDAPLTREISRSRIETLDRILTAFPNDSVLETALDVGTGLGEFAAHLAAQGLAVTAVDVRAGNVAEAQRRHPHVQCQVCDVETNDVESLGEYDLISCFGLLYHLENPLAAIRNLAAVTRQAMVVETIVAPGPGLSAWLHVESGGEDQGKHNLALIPTKRCLISMLHHAGFEYVYQVRQAPKHPEFRGSLFSKPRRTVLVASRIPLTSHVLSGPLKQRTRKLNWQRPGTRLLSRIFKPRWRQAVWRWRNRLAPSWQFPGRTPWGDRWMINNDFLGWYLWFHKAYEAPTARFLERCLSTGMVAVECGAHHGYFTLLMSRQVAARGSVISFEPSPRERSRLRRHLELSGRRNVQIVDRAVGSQSGSATLHVCEQYQTGCNSLRPPAVDESTHKVKVEVVSLDEYVRANPLARVDLIKIDAEGGELDILKGATETLASFQPLVFCELADVRTEPWGYRAGDIWHQLQQQGYVWFSIAANGRLTRCEPKATRSENLVAVPASRVDQLGGLVNADGRPVAA